MSGETTRLGPPASKLQSRSGLSSPRARSSPGTLFPGGGGCTASGQGKPGDMLPSERLLIDSYDVARPTMRGALRILESDGLISIERGTHGGARVREPDLVPLAR